MDRPVQIVFSSYALERAERGGEARETELESDNADNAGVVLEILNV